MANISLRSNETALPKGGEWRNVARQEAAQGMTLAPLNPLPVGTSYAKVLECTKAPARNRPDFFIYRVHMVACSQDGSTLYFPGSVSPTDDEKKATFSVSMTVDNVLWADDHRGEVVTLTTTSGRTANNTSIEKTLSQQSAPSIHPAASGLSTAQIEIFQTKFNQLKELVGEVTDEMAQKLAKEAIAAA